jgi:hypothetical protein
VLTIGSGIVQINLYNIFVYQRRQNKSVYVLIHKSIFYCPSGTLLTHIAGNYGDDVVGVCTYNGKPEQWRVIKMRAFVFSASGRRKRPIVLPYAQLNKGLSNDTFDFKYLQILSCEEYVYVQYNCYSKKPIYGPDKEQFLLTRGVYLYIMKPQGFIINLEHIQSFSHETLSSFTFLSPVLGERNRKAGEVQGFTVDMMMTVKRFQCDVDNNLCSIHSDGSRDVIIRYLSKGSYNYVVFQIHSETPEACLLHESLHHSCSSDYHAMQGRNIYAFAPDGLSCQESFDACKDNTTSISLFEIISIPRPCGDTTSQYRLHLLMTFVRR